MTITELISAQNGYFDADNQLVLPNYPAQIAAVQNLAEVCTLANDYSVIQITGEDAAKFLQGQFSNDLRLLDNKKCAQYSTYLNQQGRMLASFLLWKNAEDYFLLLKRDLAADTIKRLSIYILRDKVKINDVSDQFTIFFCLHQASAEELANEEASAIVDAKLAIHTDDESNTIHMENGVVLFVVKASCLGKIAQMMETITLVSSEAWRYLDIQSGIAWVSASTKELFVPQMANMDSIGAISFNKGCYTGQEVVARAHYRGQVKRHLYQVSCATELHAGDELCAVGSQQIIGNIVSTCAIDQQTWLALAVIKESAWDVGVCLNTNQEQRLQLIANCRN